MVEGRTRDLAMFNLAIDSKLRGCDVVALKVDDIAPNGYAIDRATVRQRKTGRPVKFELTDQTRQAVDDYLRDGSKKPGEFLFTSRHRSGRCMTTRQYARLVTEWIASIGLDARLLWHPFATEHQGDPDLSAHWQSSSRPALARPHQNREHCQVSRD
jgi:integrase